MILKELLKNAGKYEIYGNDGIEISDIEIDSRKIKKDNAFIEYQQLYPYMPLSLCH